MTDLKLCQKEKKKLSFKKSFPSETKIDAKKLLDTCLHYLIHDLQRQVTSCHLIIMTIIAADDILLERESCHY